ncbi:MAG: Protease HtpX [Patescibacteria group bacterium]|nr:zinc metalloprotease HtpX [Candidatus Saccharibacteria bacterium]MDQ5963528.1 Protease HtpX [Patescibacteria group bacterium]
MKQIIKTTILLAALTGLFVVIGRVFGGQQGALIALGIAFVMNFGMYWFSDKMVLKMQGAQPLDGKYPEVERIVTQLAANDGLPMPKLYWVDTPIPNAFATGRSPKHAVVAVTSGIMDILNEKELRAVLAHELGHVKNRDMLVSTIAACVGGAISYLAQMAMFFGGSDEDAPNPIAAILIMLLAPFAAMLIQMAVSRSREYLADEHSASVLHSGNDLASALMKLENFKQSVPPIQATPTEQTTAHLMFANMFSAQGIASLFSTHPSTEQRIARLKQLVS